MENTTKTSKLWNSVLCFVDSVIAIVIFAPVVVGYWRGCWQLMDHYLFPNNVVHSVWASNAIGIGLGVFFGLFQNIFNSAFRIDKNKIVFYVASRLYTIIYCVACVNHWRGVWSALDTYHNTSWQSGAMSAGIGILALTFTRGVRNILAPPFLTITDRSEGYFTVPTLFNTKKSRCGCSCQCFCLDVIFSVVITGSLVVFVWRGAWVFLDRTLFPENETYSAWGSLVIGFTVTVLMFLAQLIMAPCLRNSKKDIFKLIVEDIYFIACFIGAVNMWRGVWNILNIYLYPNKPVLSNLITAVGGNVLLMCFFCGNSILVRGAQMDGAKEGAAGTTFETNYLRSFCKVKRKPSKPHFDDKWQMNDKRNLNVNPSGYLEEPLVDKCITMDGRGAGDGNSYSGCYGDSENATSPSTLDNLAITPSSPSDEEDDTSTTDQMLLQDTNLSDVPIFVEAENSSSSSEEIMSCQEEISLNCNS